MVVFVLNLLPRSGHVLREIPNQRIIELLGRRILRFEESNAQARKTPHAPGKVNRLAGGTFLNEVGYLIKRVQLSALFATNGTLCKARRMRSQGDRIDTNTRT